MYQTASLDGVVSIAWSAPSRQDGLRSSFCAPQLPGNQHGANLQEAAADGNGAASGSGGMTRTESTEMLDAADTPFELRVLEVALDVVRPGPHSCTRA